MNNNINAIDFVFVNFNKTYCEYWFYVVGNTYEYLKKIYNSENQKITGNIYYSPKSQRTGVQVVCYNDFIKILADDIKIEDSLKCAISMRVTQLRMEGKLNSNEY